MFAQPGLFLTPKVYELSKGVFHHYFNELSSPHPIAVIQFLGHERIQIGHCVFYRMFLSDGIQVEYRVILDPKLNRLIENNLVELFAIIEIKKYSLYRFDKETNMRCILKIDYFEILINGHHINSILCYENAESNLRTFPVNDDKSKLKSLDEKCESGFQLPYLEKDFSLLKMIVYIAESIDKYSKKSVRKTTCTDNNELPVNNLYKKFYKNIKKLKYNSSLKNDNIQAQLAKSSSIVSTKFNFQSIEDVLKSSHGEIIGLISTHRFSTYTFDLTIQCFNSDILAKVTDIDMQKEATMIITDHTDYMIEIENSKILPLLPHMGNVLFLKDVQIEERKKMKFLKLLPSTQLQEFNFISIEQILLLDKGEFIGLVTDSNQQEFLNIKMEQNIIITDHTEFLIVLDISESETFCSTLHNDKIFAFRRIEILEKERTKFLKFRNSSSQLYTNINCSILPEFHLWLRTSKFN